MCLVDMKGLNHLISYTHTDVDVEIFDLTFLEKLV